MLNINVQKIKRCFERHETDGAAKVYFLAGLTPQSPGANKKIARSLASSGQKTQ